jgi:hypothetical protein
MTDDLHLNRDQLAALTGTVQPKRMVAWLEARHWVFEPPARRGDIPKVAIAYHAARMTGQPDEPISPDLAGPDFSPVHWLDQNWAGLVLSPRDLPGIDFDTPDAAPVAAGVYFLFSDNELLYVGLSNNARQRLLEHWRQGEIPFDNFSFIECRHGVYPHVELAYIDALEPPYNTLYGVATWDGHARMVQRIRDVWGAARL